MEAGAHGVRRSLFHGALPQEEDEEEEEGEDDEEEEETEDVAELDEEEEEEEKPLDPNFDPHSGEIEEDDDDILAIQTTYAAAVSWVDAALGKLLAELPDDVAVVLTADHGQARRAWGRGTGSALAL